MKIKTITRGFTLVELLVVIVVIVLLVAVVLPSRANSGNRSQEVRCLSNLRQLSIGWIAYTGDNRGKLVPNGDENHQATTPTDPLLQPGGAYSQWCPGRQDQTSNLSPVNSPVNVGAQFIKAGLLYPYINNVNAYLCPADISTISSFGAKYPQVRSVSMNAWLNPFVPFNNTQSVETYHKDSDLVRPGPAQLLVFADENPKSINEAIIIFLPGVQQWISCPASYHNGGGGLSFADGHAQIKRWTDYTVLTLWSAQVSFGNPSNIELPPSQNPPTDLTFLQNASTYLK